MSTQLLALETILSFKKCTDMIIVSALVATHACTICTNVQVLCVYPLV